ncbi:core protein [Salmonella bongori N268-08]|uniref:Core protein n=1 Tax=Salmonella bongori N268-08 TaxID=1197719 RepID=S5MWP1_SALBN|nr:RHS repeat-associated core domain-containing protein [Salmonella bongori]AGR61041.1 core protein [Salmonella bongori N268-08]
MLRENNPHNLKQLIRLPGQQYDEETGLYYNRHRYYDPLQGRYITQDPIGLRGGWNLYQYPLNPVTDTDPLGLAETSESYVVSRDLAALGDEARSRWNPLTHTFTVTTDGQGNILHTYSWGNDANLKGWNLDQSIDLKTAREALDNGLAQPTLAPSHCVEQAYTELNKKENEHINLFITRNCKQEKINSYLKQWPFVLIINGEHLHSHQNLACMDIHINYEEFFCGFIDKYNNQCCSRNCLCGICRFMGEGDAFWLY